MRVGVGSAIMFSQTIVFLRLVCSTTARKLPCATTLGTNTNTLACNFKSHNFGRTSAIQPNSNVKSKNLIKPWQCNVTSSISHKATKPAACIYSHAYLGLASSSSLSALFSNIFGKNYFIFTTLIHSYFIQIQFFFVLIHFSNTIKYLQTINL